MNMIIRYVSLNFLRKKILFLNQTSSPELEPRTVFGFVTFAPVFSRHFPDLYGGGETAGVATLGVGFLASYHKV
jgi:hypothetical protein